MKNIVSRILALAVVAGFGLAALATAQEGAWTGWVTDDHCAAAGAKAAHKDCAVKCVKEKGAKWVLYNPTDKSTFVLSGDDAMMERMAAVEVMVKGTMDKDKKMIKVTSMEASTPKAKM
jgi:hypothetical protein